MAAQVLVGGIKVLVRRVVAIVRRETARLDWPKICKEVPMHPTNRRTGGLKVPKISA